MAVSIRAKTYKTSFVIKVITRRKHRKVGGWKLHLSCRCAVWGWR